MNGAAVGSHAGVVKHWNEDRGFGFITVDAIGADVYVHRVQLTDGVTLEKGANVGIDVEEEKGKLVGKNLTGASGNKGEGKGCGGFGAPSAAGAKGGLNADYATGKGSKGKDDGWGKGKDSWGGNDGWGKGKDSWGKGKEGGGWDAWGKGKGKDDGWGKGKDDGWGKGGWDDGWGKGKGGWDDGWGGKDGGKDGWGKDSWGKGKDSWGKDGKGKDSWGLNKGGKDKGGKGGKPADYLGGNGWVRSWNDERGFGFVGMDSGCDVYVHRTALFDGQALVIDAQVSVEASWNYEKGNYQAKSCYGALGKGGEKGGGKVKAGTEAPTSVGVQAGKVKAWNPKGFGFIMPDAGGPDVFVHQNALIDTQGLEIGASVSFDLQFDEGKNKYLALSCTVDAPPPAGFGPVVVAPPSSLLSQDRSSPYGGELG